MISAEAHLWCVDLEVPAGLDASQDDPETVLSPDEQDRAARFVFARDRRRFVAARTALRSILAAWVGIPAGELAFVYGAHQKPALAPWCRARDLSFNLSHSHGVALVALTHGHEIGVDIERVRPYPDAGALVAHEFSSAEQVAFGALPAGARTEGFFRAWVRKEAFLKATGEGLYRALADIEVTFGPDQAARVLSVGGDASAARDWSIAEVLPRPGFVAAVVVASAALELEVHGFGAFGGTTAPPVLAPH